jgi:hypothetical protein
MANGLSINDIKRLVKQSLYRIETGSKASDSLIYDRQSGKYVGHIENGTSFYQDSYYQVPQYIIEYLDKFEGNSWNQSNRSW